ncbi:MULTISPECIES: hypothetical protein [Amycolatopsis]|uniref:hypothetical protein n=1 Tax=Amycolatopsis TaxID=1813 RepID=UPI000832E928|nr:MULTISPECIES: hypothetical protein [Amycolatopsis]
MRCSSINYKDALAPHGRPGIVRRPPLVVGIDLTGDVLSPRHPRYLGTLNGAGAGEDLHGGLAATSTASPRNSARSPRRRSAPPGSPPR